MLSNIHPELAQADPIKGEVAILFVPESELFAYVADGKTDAYADAVHGIYRALWNVNIQADFCSVERLADYPLVFLPFPVMLEERHAAALVAYVRGGGVLVSDAAPGMHGDHGYASPRVPGMGLDEVFGCEQDVMEYVTDDPPTIEWESMRIPCRTYQERLRPKGGVVVARFRDGSPAIVDNKFGGGKARLIGTCLGTTYIRTLDHGAELLIRGALRLAAIRPRIMCLDDSIKARLMVGPTGCFLWALNISQERIVSEITLAPDVGAWSSATNLITRQSSLFTDHSLPITLESFSGTVLHLE